MVDPSKSHCCLRRSVACHGLHGLFCSSSQILCLLLQKKCLQRWNAFILDLLKKPGTKNDHNAFINIPQLYTTHRKEKNAPYVSLKHVDMGPGFFSCEKEGEKPGETPQCCVDRDGTEPTDH